MTDLIRRFMRIDLPKKRDVALAADGATVVVVPPFTEIEVIASTDAPCSRWGGAYFEVLDHTPGAVTLAADSVLLNHDPNQIVGNVKSTAFAPSLLTAMLGFAPTDDGQEVATLVESGCLRGISIGYSIEAYTISEDNGVSTVLATAWTLREISWTPIPADTAAGVMRSSTSDEAWAKALNLSVRTTTPAIVPAKERTMDPLVPVAAAQPAAANTLNPVAEARASARAIASQAEALGLRASDYAGMDIEEARSAMLGAVVEARKAAPAPAAHDITVRTDERDNIIAQAVDAIHVGGRRAAAKPGEVALRNYGFSFDDVYGRAAQRLGFQGVLTRKKLIDMFFGERTANTTATFNQITQLASAKSVMTGYDQYTPWSDPICDFAETSDFKTYRVAGAQVGDFNEPAEGSPFTDLSILDNLTGSGVLTFRGGGLEFTKQALYNDELGIFFKKLFGMGIIAHRHQDIRVAAAIEALSFASASITGVLNAANLDLAWQAFVNVTGPASQKLGIVPKRIIVPPALVNTAYAQITANYGNTSVFAYMKSVVPGAQLDGMNAPLQIIPGLHLSSATAWYLGADPAEAQPITVLKHTDYPVPEVIEVDAGLVASRKFRVEYPMQVITATHAAGKPVGMVKSPGT
jgi:HK97 family phage prohead protease